MKNNFIKKLTLIIFVLFSLQVFSASVVSAAAKIEWDKPNVSLKSQFKFHAKDAVNSALLMQVVGCTGVVDRVAGAITDFTSSVSKSIQDKAKKAARAKACKITTKMAAGGVSFLGKEFVAAIHDANPCEEIAPAKTSDTDTKKAIEDQTAKAEASKRIDLCLNGIAKTLARNQLTSMTRDTMNWVTSGLNGDPMYVRNIDTFMGRMTDDIMMKELEMFKGQPEYYPYGNGYYQSTILGNLSLNNFKDSMKQNLSNYLDSGGLGNDAANVVDKYTNNFGSGGWNAWLAFTQYPQNNYLGYTLKTTEYIANKQNAQVEETKAELARNGGILDQKKCVTYATTAKDAIKRASDNLNADLANQEQTCQESGNDSEACLAATDQAGKSLALLNSLNNPTTPVVEPCLKYETVTPGSLIKDRVSTVLNSDVRQLELAKDINDSLNAVFSMLLSKLQSQGLTSLNPGDNINPTAGGNSYNNPVYDEVDANGKIVRTGGAGFSGSIDITKELGNTYIHDYNHTSLGNWNADTNTPKLYPGFGTSGSFYVVSVAGKTKLINDGYNGWEVGDRAYFNGTEWQNWKKGTTNPIEKRGIIQIQKDYVVAATQILGVLPKVMPKLGELDYCIPGPNPNWQANIEETSSAFRDFAGTLSTSYNGNGFTRGNGDGSKYYIAGPGDTEYENYLSIFYGSDSLFNKVKLTYAWDQLHKWIEGTWKYNSSKDIVKDQVENLLARINSHLDQFVPTYNDFIRATYGQQSPMQNEYIDHESTGIELDANGNKVKNPAYLPMAQAGLEITKDMLSYDEETSAAIQDYKDSIAEANSNVSKLEQIKQQVKVIVEAAQARRQAKLLDILAKEGNNLTEAQYKAKYKECLDEEKVVYYDENQIISNEQGRSETRCSDGIDNDLNGLIDSNDPNCPNYVAPNVRIQNTITNSGYGNGARR